jgi:hypothetical protein
MNLFFSLLSLFIILILVLKKHHKSLVFLICLSVFTDVFYIEIGPVLYFNHVIGVLIFPLLLVFFSKKNVINLYKIVFYHLRPLIINFIYLCFLGVLLGFIFPWSDSPSYRTYWQESQGRTIVTLVRLFIEILGALYIFWCIFKSKVELRFIIYSIGWILLLSFFVGILEHSVGQPIFRSILQKSPKILPDRYLGLCGEPKNFGRNAALAYILLFFYYIKYEKKKIILFFIFISIVSVFLSFSASTYLLFALFNIFLLLERKNFKLIFLALPIFLFFFNLFQTNEMFEEANWKMQKALTGNDIRSDSISENILISRFDIFDFLALLFLLNNPKFLIFGVGPNLISIPASIYVSDFIEFDSYTKDGGIDSVPNVMFNNVLSSSGIIGIILYFIFFCRLFKSSKYDKVGFCRDLIIITIIFNMVFFGFSFYFLSGIILGLICKYQIENNLTKEKL